MSFYRGFSFSFLLSLHVSDNIFWSIQLLELCSCYQVTHFKCSSILCFLFHSPLETYHLKNACRGKDKPLTKYLNSWKTLNAHRILLFYLKSQSSTVMVWSISRSRKALNKHFSIFFTVYNHIYSDIVAKLELTVVDKCHLTILLTSLVKHFSKL